MIGDYVKKWTFKDIPNQIEKIVIVTGANAGLGYEDTLMLSKKEANVIMACRNKGKSQAALESIKEKNPNAKIELMILDLSDLESVKHFAKEFKSKYSRLDILINNAGVMILPYSKTKDGFELQFGVNHLGHFALTGLLLDVLKKTKNSRIVNVSSIAHRSGSIDFEDLNWEKRKYSRMKAYGDSKIANLYFTYEFNKRFNVFAAAAHPGWSATHLQRNGGMFSLLNPIFGQSAAMGALPTLFAATSLEAKSGGYYGPAGFNEMKGYPKKVESNKLSHDRNIARKLWQVSEKLTGIRYKV